MSTSSGLIPTRTVLAHHGNPIRKLSFHSNRSTTWSMATHLAIKPLAGRMLTASMRQQHVNRLRCCASSREGNYQEWNVEDEYHQESFWLYLFKEAVRSTNLVFSFLLEQPGQLKYIEWPGFQSTLRTASLTLVLVALLIIALASTDSALSYILAILLRRKL